MKFKATLCLWIMAAAGCAAVSKDTRFDAANARSFLLVTADDMRDRHSYTFEFKKLDRSRSRLLDERVLVNFHEKVGHEFKKPENLTTPIRFGGADVSPGEYAMISRWVTSPSGAIRRAVTCFSQGAPVFELKQGQIQIVSVLAHAEARQYGMERLSADAQTLLAAYPNMTAPVSAAPLTGTLTYTVVENDNVCKPTGPVSFRPVMPAAGRS